MDRLEEARRIISEIDDEMAKLFVRRMEASQTVAEYKKAKSHATWLFCRDVLYDLRTLLLAGRRDLRSKWYAMSLQVFHMRTELALRRVTEVFAMAKRHRFALQIAENFEFVQHSLSACHPERSVER